MAATEYVRKRIWGKFDGCQKSAIDNQLLLRSKAIEGKLTWLDDEMYNNLLGVLEQYLEEKN